MFRNFSRVQRWEQPDDVLQNASQRLCRALADVPLRSARDLFRLASVQIRRELLDLAQHYYGPEGLGRHHDTNLGRDNPDGPGSSGQDPADLSREPARLSAWTEFHEQIEQLPEESREVFDLLWYQGLTQAEAADLLGVSERTVQRRWQQARLELHQALGGELPGL
jgi:RNA polymerase sigma-70 factor (ECF subfamily)